MSYDWDGLFKRLAKPWWGPRHPSKYLTIDNGARVGVGLLYNTPGWDYGAWNLTLLDQGTYANPADADGQRTLLVRFMAAKRISKLAVQHQPLGSYTMLLNPPDFHSWLRELTNKDLPKEHRTLLILATERLIDSERENAT